MNSWKLPNAFEGIMNPNSSESKSVKLFSSASKPHPSNLVEGLSKSSSFSTFHIFFAKLLHIFKCLSPFSSFVIYFDSFAEHP